MLVDLSMQQVYCEDSEQCGQGMACVGQDGGCGPCSGDSDCASGEVCVLDHCLLEQNVECRSYTDCPEGYQCILSGLSADPRGNGEMRAYCPTPDTDVVEEPSEEEIAEEIRREVEEAHAHDEKHAHELPPGQHVPYQDLLDALRADGQPQADAHEDLEDHEDHTEDHEHEVNP
jgi:hypothetical protein